MDTLTLDDRTLEAEATSPEGDASPEREKRLCEIAEGYTYVYAFVRNRYSDFPEPDVLDIVQTTFRNAVRYHQGYEGRSTLQTWLTRIAINAAQEHFRKK